MLKKILVELSVKAILFQYVLMKHRDIFIVTT